MAKVSYKEPLSGIKKKGVAKEYSDYLGSIGDMWTLFATTNRRKRNK